MRVNDVIEDLLWSVWRGARESKRERESERERWGGKRKDDGNEEDKYVTS